MSWPECGEAIHVFDMRLRCVLPKDHQYDGERMHRNEDGTEWQWTITATDGEVVEVR